MDLSFIKSFNPELGGIFVIMCGPPGCGKTTLANELVNDYNFVRISPDDIREEICGDASDQSKNVEVFNYVYKRIYNFLKSGVNVVYDATNCRTVYRFKMMDMVADLAKVKICMTSKRPLYECLQLNESRDRIVPGEVIERMYINMKKHPPVIFEGYDMIVGF